jgi:protein O-mannosyl-transferase
MSMKSQKTKSNQNSKSNRPWFPIVLLISVVFLYYGNTLNNGYSLDDDLVTTTDNSVHERVEKGISGIPEIFTTHYVHTDQQQYAYRPIVTTSFAIENQFVGDKSIKKRASISHLINVMLYALLIVLIYLLIFKLFPDKSWVFPFVVALLFLIHPVHSEVVNNIKCRDELFVMIFGLLGAFSFLKYVDSDYKKLIHLVFGILMLMLSILSKKVGITFIVLIPLILYFFRDVKIRKFAVLFSLMLTGFFVFFLLKKIAVSDGVVREVMFFENPLYFAESNLERIPMFFYSIMYYLKMMVVPAPLVYYYGYDQIEIVGWSNPFVWVGVLFVFSGVFFAVKRIKKKEMWVFGFLFFMFGVGGGANLLFPAVGIVAERFVFTGSFGLIFLAVYYGFQIYEKNKMGKSKLAFYSIGGLLLILSFSQVTSRNKDWNSRFSLYKNDIKNLSNSAKAHSLLGTEYAAKADSVSRILGSSHLLSMSYIDSAIWEFESGLEIYDGYFNCANNAGALIFSRKKDYARAKPFFSKALEYKPTYVEALFNYGSCLESDFKGIVELQKILSLIDLNSLAEFDVSNIKDVSSYQNEIKAAYSVNAISIEIRELLSKTKLKNPNWDRIAVAQIMLVIDSYLNVETEILGKGFEREEYLKRITLYCDNAKTGDPQVHLEEMVGYSEKYFTGLIKKQLFEKSLSDIAFMERLKFDLEAIKYNVYDSIEHYWFAALGENPQYYLSYKSLLNLALRENNYDKAISICDIAIANAGFEDNMEFYLTKGNIYNTQGDYDKAIVNMEKAVHEIDKLYTHHFNSEEDNRQATLVSLLNRKKQILGFISTIYYTSGDEQNAAKYQELLKGL